MKRGIAKKFKSQKVNMGGIILDQPLPQRGLEMVDPVLLIHHWSNVLPGGGKESQSGVGPHPHRGFSPVTFIFKGGVHHRDSHGNSGIIYAGGTQWMNSGHGVIHSERPHKALVEQGGAFELIQFWVNSPARDKLAPYSYQPLSAEDTPTVTSDDGKVHVGVVAGTLNEQRGPVTTNSPMLMLRLEASAGGQMKLDIPADMNAVMYVLDGAATVNDTDMSDKELIVFETEAGATEVHLHFQDATRAIVLSGAPINEPVVSYGPFVMNSEKEIMQAIQDYQSGALGVLEEKFDA